MAKKVLPIYVLNGPNLNLLGQREPEIYGRTTLAEIGKMVAKRAKSHGLSAVFRQSNHEGELIDWIQEARTQVLRPHHKCAVPTRHTSLALHDALRSYDHPILEVHLSNPQAREEFRHHSLVSPIAKGIIVGFGAHGYVLAVDALASIIESSRHMNMKDVKSIGARIANGGKAKTLPSIDATAIRELAELLAETGLTEIEIEQGGARLRVAEQAAGKSSRRSGCACAGCGERRGPGGPEGPAAGRGALAHGRNGLCRARAGPAALSSRSATGSRKATR